MKFISKSTNLLVVLSPGLSAQPITGTPAKPTVSVRFKDGIADVQQEELVMMMLAHPGFNRDFISTDNIQKDPYASLRQPTEPTHEVTELKFGTPVSREMHGANPNLTPEMKTLLQGMATDIAKSMLPSMVESTLKELLKSREEDKKCPIKIKKKAGRPPKVKEIPKESIEDTRVIEGSIEDRC
jgi:hypothetical protein